MRVTGWMALFALVITVSSGRAQAADTAEQAYQHARGLYFALKGSPTKQRFRHNWLRVIAGFRGVYEQHPTSPAAPRAAFTAGELWRGLYDISRLPDDLEQAIIAYERVLETYEAGNARERPLGDDALYHRAQIHLKRGRRVEAAAEVRALLAQFPQGDMVAKARALEETLKDVPAPVAKGDRGAGGESPTGRQLVGRSQPSKKGRVTAIRAWNNDDYTRVAIYLTEQARAQTGQVKSREGLPPRLYVDLSVAALDAKVEIEKVSDERVHDIRAAQFDRDTVRVVLDLAGPVTHRVMEMSNPRRIVLDVFGTQEAPPTPAKPTQLHVVIDPGHGGKDHGASGPNRLREKDVTLAIANEVQKLLERAGIRATLTRTDDTYLALEERTAMANRLQANAFISIHANANAKSSARGVETYYLDVTDDRYALRLAAVENQTSEEQVSELQLILTDLSTKAHTQESMVLAKRVQRELYAAAKEFHPDTRDLGVKGSLFYVLLGARCPSILVETSFITHPKEGKLLAEAKYQRALAEAIANAVASHLQAPMVAVDP